MLTYILEKKKGEALYRSLYQKIKEDIVSGRLRSGEKLPSKRAMAEHLGVSCVTVENAYEQLIAEGYLRPAQRKGYFVEEILPYPCPPAAPARRLPKNLKKTAETSASPLELDLADTSARPRPLPFLHMGKAFETGDARLSKGASASGPVQRDSGAAGGHRGGYPPFPRHRCLAGTNRAGRRYGIPLQFIDSLFRKGEAVCNRGSRLSENPQNLSVRGRGYPEGFRSTIPA